MNAIDILVDEHKLVRRYLDNVGIALDLMVTGNRIPMDFFDWVLSFSRDFLDEYHHFKEEYVVFLKLAEKKGGAIDPQVVSLRNQHESGRNFVKEIVASLDGYEKGSEVDTARLVENLGYFHELQRQHLNRENHVFFPMAREAFTDEELDEFAEEFEKEEKRLGSQIRTYSDKLVDSMANLLSDTFGELYQTKRAQLEKTRAHKAN